jgi:hypothetical protein
LLRKSLTQKETEQLSQLKKDKTDLQKNQRRDWRNCFQADIANKQIGKLRRHFYGTGSKELRYYACCAE